MELAATISRLPKAELHLHLDGALRPETAVELADAAGLPLGIEEARRRLIAPAQGVDQAALLTYFDLPIALLQTAEALERVTSELIADLAEENVRYAEIRWAPRLHLQAGLSVVEVIEAVARGIGRAAAEQGPGIPLVGLIVVAMRSHPPAANVEMAHAAASFGPPVVGFDLAGLEAQFPAPPHAAAFRAAEAGGLRLTAHAGEVPGAARVREAVELGAERVGHGVTAIEDAELLALLRERTVTLDLCPTSNVQTGIVASLAEHPLAALHRAGVSVTISTDDPTVSATTLSRELVATATALALSRAEVAAIALNAFDRAFVPRQMIAAQRAAAAAAWGAWVEGGGPIS
ncbi:MAG: adenosine deaminase [Chloroflexota bacterium]|nr:adenosine deaminase [Chloroflexota bacterium]